MRKDFFFVQVGMYDGSIAIYNVRRRSDAAALDSR